MRVQGLGEDGLSEWRAMSTNLYGRPEPRCPAWGTGLPRPRKLLTPRPCVQVWCRCITTVFNYFVVTNFFWMFVEGCYLHTAIVMTYSTERLRKWIFLFIGWCEGPGPRGLHGGGTQLKVISLHQGSEGQSTASPASPRTGPECSHFFHAGKEGAENLQDFSQTAPRPCLSE